MEGHDVWLMVMLAGLGTLFWAGLVALACYCWHVRRKRLRFHAREEEEHILATLPEPKPKSQQVYQHPSNGIARKLRNIGMASIGLRAPLVRTRSVG